MNIIKKINLDSMAGKGKVAELMEKYLSAVYDHDHEVEEYIFQSLLAKVQVKEVMEFVEKHLQVPNYRILLLKILACSGDETSLEHLIDKSWHYDDWPGEFESTFRTIYHKYETPELRLRIIALVKNYCHTHPYDSRQSLITLINDLDGWELEDADMLISHIAWVPVVRTILKSFYPRVVENLIGWLDYKWDKPPLKKIWEESVRNPLTDEIETPGHYSTYGGGESPTAAAVHDLFTELTGKDFKTSAGAKAWWKKHGAEILKQSNG